ncbi:hypothetical protein QMK33_21190 [Hymenobacter sp. H14-R3]|uniref:choice-of-anchor I domain-containing protein n=1 Tax=Hymenobacter sp. H14-R3 TaxID=3046308 RepID=UPI0024BB5C39|nr:hypothetical protein [Hymenobacter sp. H14-R3]MDJ0367669.1 hypothetical protein [Hymenobacter sp. H14-R3]
MGYSDLSRPGHDLDASDQTSEALLASWPIKGMRQPNALATFEVGGTPYLLAASEGDARDYAGFSE